GFEGLDQQKYMFFRVPDDLTGLDIVNGHCYNSSIPQNLTYGLQDEALGIHGSSGDSGSSGSGSGSGVGRFGVSGSFISVVAAAVGVWLFL
ncbi:hypothetical protein LTS18_002797, partial [Coniosporium uncinatum]